MLSLLGLSVHPFILLGLAKTFITLVILVTCLDSFEFVSEHDVLDFYAGAGRVARAARFAGLCALGMDLAYSGNPRAFDLSKECGFVSPESM